MAHFRLLAAPILALAAGCGTRANNPEAAALMRDAAMIEFGGGALSDTVEVAHANGISYELTVQRALDHDDQAISLLLRFTAHHDKGLDGAASQGHAAILGLLLRRLGDGAFSQSIKREDSETRQAVEAALLYDVGVEDVKTERHYFSDAWPMTAEALCVDR